MNRMLDVYLYDIYAGELIQDDSGDLSFSYDSNYLDNNHLAISVSMPLQEKPYKGKVVKSFFSGLLPDELAKHKLAKYLGVSEKNPFALLEIIGGECAGALSLYPKGEKPPSDLESEFEILSDEKLCEILNLLKRKPLLAGEHGVRLSLAGAQDKIPVSLVDGKVALVKGTSPTTHILKPLIEGAEDSVYNELFCMRLAEHAGITVPKVEVKKSGNIPYFLVERYDRVRNDVEGVKRLHQEDFCQALSIMPEMKYEKEGGPSIAKCQEVLQKFSFQPAKDQLEFLRRIIFNYIIGNSDAHGKNSSLLYSENKIYFAPAYDLFSTAVYPNLAKEMAMKIGGRYDPEHVYIRHWYRIVEDTSAAKKNIEKIIDSQSKLCVNAAIALKDELKNEGLESKIFDQIYGVINVRSELLRNNQGET